MGYIGLAISKHGLESGPASMRVEKAEREGR